MHSRKPTLSRMTCPVDVVRRGSVVPLDRDHDLGRVLAGGTGARLPPAPAAGADLLILVDEDDLEVGGRVEGGQQQARLDRQLGDRHTGLHRGIAGDVQREGRFSHPGPGGQNDQIGVLQAGRFVIQKSVSGGDPRNQ